MDLKSKSHAFETDFESLTDSLKITNSQESFVLESQNIGYNNLFVCLFLSATNGDDRIKRFFSIIVLYYFAAHNLFFSDCNIIVIQVTLSNYFSCVLSAEECTSTLIEPNIMHIY